MPVAYIQALQVTATNDCNYINTVVSYANPTAPFPLTGNIVYKNMGGTVLNSAPITAVLTSSGDSISIVTPTADLGSPTGIVKITYEINGNIVDENAVLLSLISLSLVGFPDSSFMAASMYPDCLAILFTLFLSFSVIASLNTQ